MLTAQQKAEAEKKLKNIGEELAHEEQIKSTIKKSSKLITEGLASLKQDKKAQLQILTKLANSILPDKILALDSVTNTLALLQERLKNQRDKCNKDALILIEDKQRYQSGIDQIKKTILNIQKTIKESVEEEVNKRKKIEDDLDNSLNEIRTKTTEFQTESQQFDKDNVQLKQKIEDLKVKLQGIQATYKAKAQQKDQEVRLEKEQLTEKLKVLQLQVEKVTEANKEYSLLEKKNFDNKLSFYLKTKKFPEFSSSFENSAKTLDSCKEELLKGVCRMNIATESIQASQKTTSQNNVLYLIELKRQQQKETRIEEIKKQKEAVRARIIQLQSKIKQKKAETTQTNN